MLGGKQLDPGPWEIRVRDNGNIFVTIGFSYVVAGSGGNQTAYFILKSNATLPLPHGHDYLFNSYEMDGVVNPNSFYKWVEKNGDLGPNTNDYEVDETISGWSP